MLNTTPLSSTRAQISGGERHTGARPLEPMSGNDQCAKWRVPVRYIVMPAAFAASIDSWSRTEPPG